MPVVAPTENRAGTNLGHGPADEPGKGSRKSADKRRELAAHALSALAELGFARVNLRDIATRSGVSLGVIHYYFADKSELLIRCVGLYKEEFVRQLDAVIVAATDLTHLRSGFADALVKAVQEQSLTHRLWYDARAQALFDPAFRDIVDHVESQLIGVVQRLLDRRAAMGDAASASAVALDVYLQFDAWFRFALQQHLAGDPQAATAFRQRLERI